MTRACTKTTSGGFTLFEMMIAVAVLGIAIAGIFSTIQRAGGMYSENSTITYLEATSGDAMEKLMEELSFASPVAIDADGNGMTCWAPIDADGVNGPLDASGNNVEWGYDGHLNYERKLSFVAQDILSEAALKQDINGDTDMVDNFQTGALAVETLDASGNRVGSLKKISPSIFIVTYPVAGLDSNADTIADPIYLNIGADGEVSEGGPMLKICLVAAEQDSTRKWHMTTKTVSIRLRNISLE